MWTLKRGSIPVSWIIILLASIAGTAKIIMALQTRGTNDVMYWELFLNILRRDGGIAVYQQVSFFNHPPFVLHLLAVLGELSTATGLFLPFWLRLPAILADVGSLLVLAQLATSWPVDLRVDHWYVLVALIAVAPISIMISGFHGNTDPVMVLLVLLAIYLLEVKHQTWLAGAAFGMALNIKVLPLIFVPAIALYLWTPRAISLGDRATPLEALVGIVRAGQSGRVLRFFAMTGGVVFLGSLPYLLERPGLLARQVLGYESSYGHWGISRVLDTLAPGSLLARAYARTGRFLVLALVVLAAGLMNRGRKRVPLFHQCGLTAFLFMAFSPGFGVQYLAWLVPWVVGVGLWPTVTYLVTSGVFAFLVYTSWSLGIPWYFADGLRFHDWWSGPIVWSELLCWASVLVILGLMLRQAVPIQRWAEEREAADGRRTIRIA
jgi:hypothetical protein